MILQPSFIRRGSLLRWRPSSKINHAASIAWPGVSHSSVKMTYYTSIGSNLLHNTAQAVFNKIFLYFKNPSCKLTLSKLQYSSCEDCSPEFLKNRNSPYFVYLKIINGGVGKKLFSDKICKNVQTQIFPQLLVDTRNERSDWYHSVCWDLKSKKRPVILLLSEKSICRPSKAPHRLSLCSRIFWCSRNASKCFPSLKRKKSSHVSIHS